MKDINPGPAASSPAWLTEVNGTLLLAANDGVTGVELWGSDGTAAGTVQAKDIRSGDSSEPSQLIDLDGTVFFGVSNVPRWGWPFPEGVPLGRTDPTIATTAVGRKVDRQERAVTGGTEVVTTT